MEQSNIPQELEDELAANWDALVAQSAAAVCRRHEAHKRWEERLANVRAAALVVGAFLIVEFPIACFALQKLTARAIESCVVL